MVRISKNDMRTLKEKEQKRVYEYFKKEFITFYCVELKNPNDVLICFDKKLKDKYAFFEINERYNSILIHLNMRLIDENKKIVKLTAQRMAIKIHIFKKGGDFSELSPEYLAYSKHYHIYNYNNLKEVPDKWHVYICNKCGIPLAIGKTKLPENSPLFKQKTPYHNKKLVNEAELDEYETTNPGKAHQGRYSYSGYQELTNEEAQKILATMKATEIMTDNFKNNEKITVRPQTDDDFDFDFDFDDF